jgi:hypothetical protein
MSGLAGIDHIRAAGVFVLGDDFLPGLTAIRRAIDSALFAGAVGMAEHGGEYAVGVARINGERRNLLVRRPGPKVRPCLAGVGGFVNAVAHREVGAVQSLAAADINNVGV